MEFSLKLQQKCLEINSPSAYTVPSASEPNLNNMTSKSIITKITEIASSLASYLLTEQEVRPVDLMVITHKIEGHQNKKIRSLSFSKQILQL
jgi:hypothetical protein